MFGRFLREFFARQNESAITLQGKTGSRPSFKQRGDAALKAGELVEAEGLYRSAIDSTPTDSRAHFMLGYVLREQGQLTAAAASLSQALAIDPSLADAHYVLGSMHQASGRTDAAVDHLRKVVQLDPANAYAPRELCLAFSDAGRFDEAMSEVEKAVARDPLSAELHVMAGNVRDLQGRYADAVTAYERALEIAPDSAHVHSNRGLVLTDLGRYDEALEAHARALRIQPDYENAHYNEGLCRLLLGELPIGWSKYEYRWKSTVYRQSQGVYGKRSHGSPVWLGETSLAGKTILVHPEQGLGDTIQFCRYVQVLSSMGATVVLEVQPSLKRVLSDVPGASRVLAVGEPIPTHDVHCPLMSLPLACGTTLDNIPAADGYLGNSAEHRERVEHWRIKLGPRSKPRVGVVWSGSKSHKNDANRSIPWAEFSRIVSDRQEFICLHNELRDDDRALLKARSAVRLFLEDLTDFTETAALIANLDLVVCVDTSVAHLAGALGKPVWVLLPANPDWRWMLERRDSPWYASMRLFRQSSLGNWDQTLTEVCRELESAVPELRDA